MKTAIVLGATGLIGASTVQQLSQSDEYSMVKAITRKPVNYESNKVANRVIDFENMKEHADAFQGDVLFSCLGTTLKQAGSISAQRVVDYNYQAQAAKIAADNKLSHYLLVSSSGANSRSKSPYLKMKGELEDVVEQLPFDRISIFQPSLLLGQRDDARFGETVASWILPSLCKFPPLKRYRPIKGSDVARKMIAVSLNEGNGIERYRLDEIFR